MNKCGNIVANRLLKDSAINKTIDIVKCCDWMLILKAPPQEDEEEAPKDDGGGMFACCKKKPPKKGLEAGEDLDGDG